MAPRANIDLNTILKAATEIADSQGMDAVTLASVAKKLNIKSPSLYNHVNGMSGLRKHLAVYGTEELYSVLVKATIGRAGDEAVHRLGEAYVSFVRNHPGLYDAMILSPDPQDEDLQVAGQKTVDLVLCVLNAYNLKKEDEIHIVRGLRSMLHGFASLEQKGGFAIPLNPDDSFRRMIDTFLRGLRHFQKNN